MIPFAEPIVIKYLPQLRNQSRIRIGSEISASGLAELGSAISRCLFTKRKLICVSKLFIDTGLAGYLPQPSTQALCITGSGMKQTSAYSQGVPWEVKVIHDRRPVQVPIPVGISFPQVTLNKVTLITSPDARVPMFHYRMKRVLAVLGIAGRQSG